MQTRPIDLAQITVTTEALLAWRVACRDALGLLPTGVDIPDEQAELLPTSGRLRLFVPHPTQRRRVLAAIVVPPDHWTWRS